MLAGGPGPFSVNFETGRTTCDDPDNYNEEFDFPHVSFISVFFQLSIIKILVIHHKLFCTAATVFIEEIPLFITLITIFPHCFVTLTLQFFKNPHLPHIFVFISGRRAW